jgi:ATP-dependent Zn protease
LESKRAAIESIAKILLEKEVLEGDELRKLLKFESRDKDQMQEEAKVV